VTEKNISWYHCGRCGSLFRASTVVAGVRQCSNCGKNPSLRLEALNLQVAAPAAQADTPEVKFHGKGRSSGSKSKKGNHLMVKLLLGWVVLILGIIAGAQFLIGEAPEAKKSSPASEQAQADAMELDSALIQQSMPLVQKTMSNFIDSQTPEEWNQFILAPIAAAGRIDRYYSLNPRTNISTKLLNLTHYSIIKLPKGKAVECYWTTDNGQELDTLFIEENGEWLLDWDHYVRYSDYPWALFLAGDGSDVGEFRLLARERLADERKNEDAISVALYAPRFGHSNELGFASPEFLVKRSSRSGRLLDAAFKLRRGGKHVFESQLPGIDPEGLIRVRAKIRRFKGMEENQFEVEEVIACHWYSTDDPGVEIPEEPPAK